MKICIFCHDSYMSGANMSLYDWISKDKNDEFYIVLPHYTKKQNFEKLSNVRIINGKYFCLTRDLTSKPCLYRFKKAIKKIYMRLFEKNIISRLCKLINDEQVDVIISNSFTVIYGGIVAMRNNIPHFWHIREFMELDHQITHYDKTTVNKICNYSYAIYISEVIEEYYKNKYIFRKSIVIHNRIKIDENFDYNKTLFENDKIRIIMSGTLQENKGQKEAIKAAKKLIDSGYNIQFDIYGDGPQKKELQKQISNCSSISLKGYSDRLNQIRKKYDIALVCSTNEALGRVTIESMGSGCITIGANSGCTKYIINDNVNGLLYQLHDSTDLKNKIIYAYNNVEKMKTIRTVARKYVEDEFSKPIHNKIVKFILDCCTED